MIPLLTTLLLTILDIFPVVITSPVLTKSSSVIPRREVFVGARHSCYVPKLAPVIAYSTRSIAHVTVEVL